MASLGAIMKTLKLFLTVLSASVSLICHSQVFPELKSKRLQTIAIDTTSEYIFVYEVPNATLYFRQSDITNIINQQHDPNVTYRTPFVLLRDTLMTNNKVIRVKGLLNFFGEKERDSIMKQEPIPIEEQYLDEAFHIAGVELLLLNRFMVVSKKSNKMISEGIRTKEVEGPMGSRYLDFLLPKRIIFYTAVIALGE